MNLKNLASYLIALKQNGIRRVVMAGAIARPQFDKSKMDEYTLIYCQSLMQN